MKAVRNGLGGVILFDRDQQTNERRNITSPGQVTALVKTLREASPGRLIVSIDQEGGRITRLNPDNGFPAVKSQAEIGAANSTTMTDMGRRPGGQPHINRRQPQLRAGRRHKRESEQPCDRHASTQLLRPSRHRRPRRGDRSRGPPAAGVKTSLKHFPGSGSETGNTDFDVVDVSTTWQPAELEPFQDLIAGGLADSVMAAHVLNRQLDPDRPASLSPAVVTDLLRGRLGYNGPVVSDDMQAVAISSRYGRGEAVAMALEAGLDLLVFANQQTYDSNIVDETIDNIVNLVHTGRLAEKQIDQSVAPVDTLRPQR